MNDYDIRCLLKGELLNRITRRYPAMDPDTLELLTQVKQISATMESIGNRHLAEFGLSEGRFYILAFLMMEELQEHDDPHPSTIADNLGVTRATVTGLLDGLERDGFVERFHNSADRRAVTVCLTTHGREIMDAFLPRQVQVIDDLFSPLEPEEKRDLIRLLAKLEPSPTPVLTLVS